MSHFAICSSGRWEVTASWCFHKESFRFCSKLNHAYSRMNKQLDFIQVFVSVSDGFAETACMDSSFVGFFYVHREQLLSWRNICILIFMQGNYSIFVLIQHLAHILNISSIQGPLKPVEILQSLQIHSFLCFNSHTLTCIYFCKYACTYMVKNFKVWSVKL